MSGEAHPADLSGLGPTLMEFAIIGAVGAVAVVALTVGVERLRARWTWPLAGLPAAPPAYLASPPIGVALAVVLGGSAALALGRNLQRLEHGGAEARRARESVGVASLLACAVTVRRARADRVRGDRLVLGLSRNGRACTVPLGTRQGVRGFVPGAPGSGKTVTLAVHASAYIAAGMSVVCVDPKGDPYLREVLEREATRAGRAFAEWSPDGPSAYNPLGRGSPSEIADKALAAEHFTEPHYLRQAQRYLGLALRTMRAAGEWPPSLSRIVHYFDADRLDYLTRRCQPELADHVATYVAQLSARARGELGGVRDRLAVLAESELGPWLEPRAGSELDLSQVLLNGEVAYIQLDADRFALASQMLGAAIVVDLVNVTAGLHGGRARGLVLIDEFAALAAEQVSRLLSRSRSAGLSVLIGTQSFADLTVARPNDQTDSLRRQVLSDVDYVVAHRQGEPEAAEILGEMAGTQPTWTLTRHTRTRLGASTPAEEGTRKRSREFVRHPDEFKRLRVGEAIVIEPVARRDPAVVQIWLPPNLAAAA